MLAFLCYKRSLKAVITVQFASAEDENKLENMSIK
jgi:hypothetical protein